MNNHVFKLFIAEDFAKVLQDKFTVYTFIMINVVENLIIKHQVKVMNNIINYIIIINSYTLVTSIRSTHERLYAMCVKWTKFSEIENHSLFIWLLHAVEMIRLKLCIKFIHVDCMLENEYSNHFKLLQKLHFHHYSCCCSEIFRDRDDYLIVQEVNIT